MHHLKLHYFLFITNKKKTIKWFEFFVNIYIYWTSLYIFFYHKKQTDIPVYKNIKTNSPANIALCAWNSLPATDNVTSLNFWFSNSIPKSSDNRHSGTLNCIVFDCPEILTLSATTLTWKLQKKKKQLINSIIKKNQLSNIYNSFSLPNTSRYRCYDLKHNE